MNNWTSTHASLLSDFINAANGSGMRFFILRNYEKLPWENPSKDVDIIIEPGSYKLALKLLQTYYIKYGFFHISVLEFEKVHCIYGANTTESISIHIDLIEGYRHKGFEIFSFDEFYSNSHSFRNFRVLNEPMDVVVLLYYKLFAAKKLIPRYQEKISIGFQNCRNEITTMLERTSGRKVGRQITTLLEKQDYSALGALSRAISIATKTRVFFHHPLRTLWRVSFFCWQKFRNIIICPQRVQKFVAVLGPDGVGKSTFIDLLEKKINFYYVADGDKCKMYHHRPGKLPNLGALGEKAKIMKEDKNFEEPHRSRPAGMLSSLLRMVYYWMDYFLFVPILIRRNTKWDFVTLFDRYIYDFLIDPRRSRIKLPYAARKFFTLIVPQPQIVFILLTDAEVIYKRKPELTQKEISRQVAEYRKLASASDRFVILDASQTPEQLAQQAVECILRTFSANI